MQESRVGLGGAGGEPAVVGLDEDRQHLTVAEAAALLRVTPQRVRQLALAGELAAVRTGSGRWLIERHPVEERALGRPRAGRRVAPRTAWAVLVDLATRRETGRGVRPRPDHPDDRVTVHPRELRAVRQRGWAVLDGLPDPSAYPETWSHRLAGRADATRHWFDRRVLSRLLADEGVVVGGVRGAQAAGLDITVAGTDPEVIYVRSADAESVTSTWRLRPRSTGGLILRVIPSDVPAEWVATVADHPELLAALDLLDLPDPRARHAGAEVLAPLARMRRNALPRRMSGRARISK